MGEEPYTLRATRRFSKKLTDQHQNQQKAVKSILKKLRDNPYEPNSHHLGNIGGQDLRGKRATHVGGGRFALLFCVCEECQDKGFWQFNRCSGCDGTPTDHRTVICIAFDAHDKLYRSPYMINLSKSESL